MTKSLRRLSCLLVPPLGSSFDLNSRRNDGRASGSIDAFIRPIIVVPTRRARRSQIFTRRARSINIYCMQTTLPTSVYQRRFRNDWSNFRGIRSVFAIVSIRSLWNSSDLRMKQNRAERSRKIESANGRILGTSCFRSRPPILKCDVTLIIGEGTEKLKKGHIEARCK